MQTSAEAGIETHLAPIIQKLAELSDICSALTLKMEDFEANNESALHDISNRIQVTQSRINDLSTPPPAPIDENWEDEPPSTPPAVHNNPSPQPLTRVLQDNGQQEVNISAMLTAIADLKKAQDALPGRLERGTLQALISTLDVRKQLLWVVFLLALTSLSTAALVVIGLHYFPAPLNSLNEGQLFQIYKKIP